MVSAALVWAHTGRVEDRRTFGDSPAGPLPRGEVANALLQI